eukprot:2475763-Prymnesium_polylepis.2
MHWYGAARGLEAIHKLKVHHVMEDVSTARDEHDHRAAEARWEGELADPQPMAWNDLLLLAR